MKHLWKAFPEVLGWIGFGGKKENFKEKKSNKKKLCVHVFISFEMGILSTHGAVFFRTRKCCDEININHHKLSGQACRDISKIVLNEKREGGGGIKKI